ncbi:chromate transporter [Noviherbaspirillum aerium]|uniref:chromate transporter n=1 Tax=Noviherbaspirillum aerium TaxID=2588497 RepID=UPI00124DDC1B|nr:chromate transporter [Noviherbaspirillum aerium]
MDTVNAPPRAQPQSLTDLFTSFTFLALQGFGGVLAVVQHNLVEKKHWLTKDEFVEEWAVAQIMPGPNVVNLALIIGGRYFGLRGALTALAGMLLVPLMLLLALAIIYAHVADHPGIAGALRGMGAVAAGLIGASGLKLASILRTHPLGLPLAIVFCVSTLVVVAAFRWPLYVVLPVFGGLSCLLTYRKLKP